MTADMGLRAPSVASLTTGSASTVPDREQAWNPKAATAEVPTMPPARWLHRQLPRRRQRALLLVVLGLAWGLAVLVLSDAGMPLVEVDGVYKPVRQLSCTDSFWPADVCGLEGENCLPSQFDEVLPIACPAHCGKTKTASPHLVGAAEVVNQPLVVGGPYYRADSHICASAVHYGLFDDARGGCGLARTGAMTNSFQASHMYGIGSVAVGTYFPMAFRFRPDSAFACAPPRDRRWLLPYLSAAFTSAVVLFSASAAVPLLTAVAVGFVHARLTMRDPETASVPVHLWTATSSAAPLSALGALAVAALCAGVVYKRSQGPTSPKVAASLDRAALWLGAFWLGLLSFSVLPQFIMEPLRTPLYYFALAGLLSLPRLKHTSSSRLVLLSQGLLLGLFVVSIARSGLAPPFSATAAPGTGPAGPPSGLLPTPPYPEILAPAMTIGFGGSNATFHWRTPVPAGVDGISMLLNDVERERRHFSASSSARHDGFVWRRTPQAVPDFIRFGWVREGRVLAWSPAGTWEADGTWTGIDGVGAARARVIEDGDSDY